MVRAGVAGASILKQKGTAEGGKQDRYKSESHSALRGQPQEEIQSLLPKSGMPAEDKCGCVKHTEPSKEYGGDVAIRFAPSGSSQHSMLDVRGSSSVA